MNKFSSMEAEAVKDGRINRDALVNLLTQAMASGFGFGLDRARKGDIDPAAPLTDNFASFADEFADIRSDLIDALLAGGAR